MLRLGPRAGAEATKSFFNWLVEKLFYSRNFESQIQIFKISARSSLPTFNCVNKQNVCGWWLHFGGQYSLEL